MAVARGAFEVRVVADGPVEAVEAVVEVADVVGAKEGGARRRPVAGVLGLGRRPPISRRFRRQT